MSFWCRLGDAIWAVYKASPIIGIVGMTGIVILACLAIGVVGGFIEWLFAKSPIATNLLYFLLTGGIAIIFGRFLFLVVENFK